MCPASRKVSWLWSMPTRIFAVTGMPAGSHTATTRWMSSVKMSVFQGKAEPPPRRVTLGTGQPKFRSTWSAMLPSITIFAACSVMEGFTPYNCSERIFFAFGEMTEAQCFRVMRHEGSSGDHLGHVESIGTVFLADHAEGPVGHSRHRREHQRGRHGDVAGVGPGRYAPGSRARRRVRTWVEVVGLVMLGEHCFGFGLCHVIPKK